MFLFFVWGHGPHPSPELNGIKIEPKKKVAKKRNREETENKKESAGLPIAKKKKHHCYELDKRSAGTK